MKSLFIISLACLVSLLVAILFLAVIPFALAIGATIEWCCGDRAELARENAKLRARNEQLCEALAERAVPARCEVAADRMTRMFGTL
jgi:Flp pilus assembly protein TadB